MGDSERASSTTEPAFQSVPASSKDLARETVPPGVKELGSLQLINLDTIPEARVLVVPPNGYSATPSKAESKRTKKGVYSHDPILDHDPDELWRFLVSNLDAPPAMSVRVHGTHTQTSTSSTGTNGTTSTTTTTITDFSIIIDVSKFVIPQRVRVVAHPTSRRRDRAAAPSMPMPLPLPTIRDTIEEYTKSRNQFKEFRLAKCVVWSYDTLTQLFTDLVRSTGYRHKVHVSFPMRDYKVVALASNEWSRAAHSKLVRVLCVASCLWILFWPAWALARKRPKNRLSCEWEMGIGVAEFYGREWARVREVVVQRRKHEQEVAL